MTRQRGARRVASRRRHQHSGGGTCGLQVWEVADTEGERLTAAAGLAAAGADLPDLDRLEADFPDLVAEMELLSRALRASGGDELAVLRANVAQSPVMW